MAEAHKEAPVLTASSASSRAEGPSVPSTFTAYSGSRYPTHMYIYIHMQLIQTIYFTNKQSQISSSALLHPHLTQAV
jgi:hypothetical protein